MKRVIVRRHVVRAAPPTVARTAPLARYTDNLIIEGFNPSMLGLGDISQPAREIEAIAAVFDLAGFTTFCNHVDPHLVVPKFLSRFMSWLFSEIKIRLTEASQGDRKVLWAELPFLVKFLGDGVLLLWNTSSMSETLICKAVATLYEISRAYRTQFYPEIKMAVDKPPAILRCGVARGRVFTVGNGKDCIGHCINTAARLQKLSLLTFCFPARGFNMQQYMPESYRKLFVQKVAAVRGVGDDELVWVLADEFNRLPESHKEPFRNP
jgi:class 3 adenylate cyclase